MKKAFTLLVIIISPMCLLAQQKWVSVKVDDRITVGFPFAPKKIDSNCYMSVEADSSKVYALYILDLKEELGADSAMIDQVKNKPDFASGLGQIAVKSVKGLKISEVKIGSLQGFTSYTTSGTDIQGKIYQLLMLIVGSKFYTFMEFRVSRIKDEKAEQFFSTIKIN